MGARARAVRRHRSRFCRARRSGSPPADWPERRHARQSRGPRRHGPRCNRASPARPIRRQAPVPDRERRRVQRWSRANRHFRFTTARPSPLGLVGPRLRAAAGSHRRAASALHRARHVRPAAHTRATGRGPGASRQGPAPGTIVVEQSLGIADAIQASADTFTLSTSIVPVALRTGTPTARRTLTRSRSHQPAANRWSKPRYPLRNCRTRAPCGVMPGGRLSCPSSPLRC